MDRAAALVEQHPRLVWHVIRRHNLPPTDESYADGLVGLWRAAQRWDPARPGARPLSYFAVPFIHGEIVDGLRARTNSRRVAQAAEVTLDGLERVLRADEPDPAESAAQAVDTARALRATLDDLDGGVGGARAARALLVRRIAGETLTEAAGHLGVSLEYACRQYRRARSVARVHGLAL